MQSIDETVLFQTPCVQVVHRTPSDRQPTMAAVTFTTWRPNPAQNLDRGFAEGLFLKHGIAEILVKNGRNDWYQHADIATLMGPLAACLSGYNRVISYGASMGAYACLNFSRIIRAHRCFALSPQFSVDPAKVPFETRWQSDSARIRFVQDDLNGALFAGTRHVVLFDPNSRDAQHVNLIGDAKVQKIGLNHAGHFTLNTIKDLGLLGTLFQCILDDSHSINAFADRYHQAIRSSPWRVLGLAERSINHPNRLLRLWARFRDAPPSDPVPFEKMALFLILARRHAEALDALNANPELLDRPYALSLRARALAGLGDVSAARRQAVRVADLVGPGHDWAKHLKSLGIAA